MRHLDLFSGIGGFALAAQWLGIQTMQFVEIDDYCQKLLAKNFPGIPIHGDITTFSDTSANYNILTGGFPCQDISHANHEGNGLDGKRSGLFYELMRIVRECRPRYIVLENVAALLSKRKGRDMGAVLWELSQCGYDAEWQVVSAASVGAPHLRKRLFIVAYPSGRGLETRQRCSGIQAKVRTTERLSDAAYRNSARRRQDLGSTFERTQTENAIEFKRDSEGQFSYWETKPPVLRMDDGISNRLDRIRGLGNAVLPQVALVALNRVLEIESGRQAV